VTLRRTGFGRYMLVRKPPTAMTMAQRAGLGLRVSQPRVAVMAHCAAMSAPVLKTEPHRNRHLLDMASAQRCLLRAPGVTCALRETTVACHSNLAEHGKAGARKADDEYSVWGCFACHRWLDQGPADATLKTVTFMRAHLDQVAEWRAIAADPGQPARDRAAAQWALDHLNATPVAALESPL